MTEKEIIKEKIHEELVLMAKLLDPTAVKNEYSALKQLLKIVVMIHEVL